MGAGCKQLQRFLDGTKAYNVTALLGVETDTDDADTDVISRTAPFEHVTRESIEKVLPKYTGKIQQMPPLFSALKMGGRPMYDYARNGIETPEALMSKTRQVMVHKIRLVDFLQEHEHPYYYPSNYPSKLDACRNTDKIHRYLREPLDTTIPRPAPVFRLEVECGPGFYVRSICRDIARDLASAAHVVQLERSQQGRFALADCLTLEQCMGPQAREYIEEAMKKAWEREGLRTEQSEKPRVTTNSRRERFKL